MANTPRFCPKCGLPVDEGARFCQGCGEKFPAQRPASPAPDTSPNQGKTDAKPFLIGCVMLTVIGVIFAACVVGVIAYRYFNGGLLPMQAARPTPVSDIVEATLSPDLPTSTMTLPVAVSPTPVPTVQPSVTLPAGPEPNLVYNGIRLYYDPALANGVNPQTVPARPASDQVAPWDVAPQHVEVVFQGYALKDTFHTATLYVYPAAEYAQASETAGQIIADLRKLLADQPKSMEHIPFLPVWNAGQMMHANVAYLSFQNGSGVRFLTQYAQAVYPINNQNLFYTFQGLTTDGKYYVSLVLPVSHPALPANGDLSATEYNALENNYQNYINGIVQLLNAQAPESFLPDLAKLDQMVQSLEVK